MRINQLSVAENARNFSQMNSVNSKNKQQSEVAFKGIPSSLRAGLLVTASVVLASMFPAALKAQTNSVDTGNKTEVAGVTPEDVTETNGTNGIIVGGVYENPWDPYVNDFENYSAMTPESRQEIVNNTKDHMEAKIDTLYVKIDKTFDEVHETMHQSLMSKWENLPEGITKSITDIAREKINEARATYNGIYEKIAPSVVDLSGSCSSFNLGLQSEYSQEEVEQMICEELETPDLETYMKDAFIFDTSMNYHQRMDQLRSRFSDYDQALYNIYDPLVANSKVACQKVYTDQLLDYNTGKFSLDNTIPDGTSAQEAYLVHRLPQNITRNLVWEIRDYIEENPTGIQEVTEQNDKVETPNQTNYTYTLSGARVNSPSQSGIYVINGKKVAVK